MLSGFLDAVTKPVSIDQKAERQGTTAWLFTSVITDSGGIQEETTFLGVTCLTVRENTERPITIEQGTNILVGRNPARLGYELERKLCAT